MDRDILINRLAEISTSLAQDTLDTGLLFEIEFIRRKLLEEISCNMDQEMLVEKFFSQKITQRSISELLKEHEIILKNGTEV